MPYHDHTMSTATAAKNAVGSFREVVQDLLVPELKAVKVSVDSLHSEIGFLRSETKVSLDSLRSETKVALDSLRSETKVSLDSLRSELKGSLDSLREEVKLRDEISSQGMRNLSEKLDFAIDIRERLATLEARLPRQ